MKKLSQKSTLEQGLRRLCIITDYLPAPSETFIRAHIERLPAEVVLIHGWRPTVGNRRLLSFPERLVHKALRILTGRGLQLETTATYARAFKHYRTEAVLAEYGTTGVKAMEACRRLGIPLIVHFFGFDATEQSILKEHAETYPAMFAKAAAVIACSRAMQKKLISLGAHPDIVHYNPCGADCEFFRGAAPNEAAAVFLAVGRFFATARPLSGAKPTLLPSVSCPRR